MGIMSKSTKRIAVAAALLQLSTVCVQSATFVSTITPSITVVAACEAQTRRNLDFGTTGILAINVDNFARIRVRCSAGVPYSIGLDAGTTAGGSTTTRKMISGSETIDYQLFRNNARTRNWGNNVGVDTVNRTGNGNWQGRRIFGRVPPQTTPSSGTYTDTVTAIIYY